MAFFQHRFSLFINALVCLFFISQLAFKGAYNISSALLMLSGVIFTLHYHFIKKGNWQLSKVEKWLIFSFIFYFLCFVFSMALNHGKLRELDNPSRVILLVPLLLLFNQQPIQFKYLLHSIPWGALIAGIIAIIQRFVLHYPMAFAYQMHIQAGDIAMSLGLFSLSISLYFNWLKQYKLGILYFLFSLLGMLASFLSTARGGWLGVPMILLIIVFTYRQFLSRKQILSLLIMVTALITALSLIPNTKLTQRIAEAKDEIHAYFEHNNGSTSVGARFDMWKSALLMAQEKPLFGWGTEGASLQRQEQAKQQIISEFAGSFNHAHNQYLDDLSKRGLFGLTALLMVFLLPLSFFCKNLSSPDLTRKTIALLGCIHVLSVMFYGFSQGFLTHNSGNIFYFVGLVIFFSLMNAQQKNSQKNTALF